MYVNHRAQPSFIRHNGSVRHESAHPESDDVKKTEAYHPHSSDLTTPVSIISNNRLLREGLVKLLSEYLNILLVGSYVVGQDILATLTNPPGHVVLIDGTLGREAVMGWLQYWRSQTPSPAAMILELPNERSLIVDFFEAGASGYTLQGAAPAEVATTIQRLLQKTASCSPEVTAELIARLSSLKAAAADLPTKLPLTGREFEVLRCIADGLSNQDIADKLVIEVRTVKHHVHNILKKLDLSHRWEAARLAIEHGWLLDGGAQSHALK